MGINRLVPKTWLQFNDSISHFFPKPTFCLCWNKLGAGKIAISALADETRRPRFGAFLSARLMLANIWLLRGQSPGPAVWVRGAWLFLLCAVLFLAQMSPAAFAIEAEHLNGREEICSVADSENDKASQFDEVPPASLQVKCKCTAALTGDLFGPTARVSGPESFFEYSAALYDAAVTFVAARATIYRTACRGPPPVFEPMSTSLSVAGFGKDSIYRNPAGFRA